MKAKMRCLVSACGHDSGASSSQGITFYLLPTQPSLREKWLKALGKEGWKSTKVHMVCSNHFHNKDLYTTEDGQRKLRANAVPVVQVCRICFATDCNLYSMADYKNLNQAYETVAGLMVESEVDLPPYLCSMCARRLLNCARFRASSLRSHCLLLELTKKHDQITLKTIQSLKENKSINPKLSVTHRIDKYDLNIVHVKREKDNIDESNVEACSETITTQNNMIELEIFNDRVPSLHEETIVDDLKMEYDNVNSKIIDKDENRAHCKVKMEPNDPEKGNNVELESNNSHENPVVVYIKTECEALMASENNLDSEHTSGEDVSLENLYDGSVNGGTENVSVEFEVNACDELNNDDGQRDEGSVGISSIYNHHAAKELVNSALKKNRRVKNGPRLKTIDLKNKLYRHLVVRSETDSMQRHVENELRNKETESNKNFICFICNKGFGYKSYLRKHLRHHAEVKPHACSQCMKSFITKSKLNRHVLTHFRKKPFSCELCNKTFRNEGTMSIHLKIHSGEKPFACDICRAGFRDKRDLRKHVKIHTNVKPFSCDICTKAFSMKHRLRRHIGTHSGEKPYSCDACGKRFREKSNLQKHFRIHSGSKPYSCKVCSKSFTENSVLKRHLRLHSGE